MKLAAVQLARTLAYIDTDDLNLNGHIFFPDLIRDLVANYKFQVFPQTVEQFDVQKGVEFRGGRLEGNVIEAFKIFPNLLVVETRSNTSKSRAITEDILEWGKGKLNLNYEPQMIRHWAYVSSLAFHSEVPLLGKVSLALSRLANKTSDEISRIWQEPIIYEPAAIAVGHDPLKRKDPLAAFYIAHRQEHPFAENKFVSEAPLPTDLHIKFLEEFEADVLS